MAYDFELSDDEKRELLRIARAGLREFFRSGRLPPGKPHRESLVAPAGVFVTLYREGRVCGSAGNFDETEPLFRGVQHVAVGAATRDPRFDPLTRDALGDVRIELSVLWRRRVVADPTAVEAHVHGVSVSSGPRRGILLPRSAAGEDAETLVARACAEAGLAADAWTRDDVELELFSAQVFDDLTHPPR